MIGSVESFWSEKNTPIRIAGTKQGQSEQLFQVSRGYRGVRGVGRGYAPVAGGFEDGLFGPSFCHDGVGGLCDCEWVWFKRVNP